MAGSSPRDKVSSGIEESCSHDQGGEFATALYTLCPAKMNTGIARTQLVAEGVDDIVILVDTRADRPVVIITELGDKNEVDGRV